MSKLPSSVSAFRAMTAAFLAAENQILGPNREWHPVNPSQARLITEIFQFTRPEADKFPEIETAVDWSEVPINKFLEDRGMDIRLKPLGADTFAFAAMLKIGVQWLAAGRVSPIVGADGVVYSGAVLESKPVDGRQSVTFQMSSRHDQPIATILTKTGDIVHLTRFDEEHDSFGLAARSREIMSDVKPLHAFGGVHFPMIDADIRPDLGWLLEMWTMSDRGRKAKLVQALQQFKLQMNHEGAIVKDAFAGAAMFESCIVSTPKPNLVLNDDFLFILDRPGLKMDVCAAVLRPDVWKDPGKLKFV